MTQHQIQVDTVLSIDHWSGASYLNVWCLTCGVAIVDEAAGPMPWDDLAAAVAAHTGAEPADGER